MINLAFHVGAVPLISKGRYYLLFVKEWYIAAEKKWHPGPLWLKVGPACIFTEHIEKWQSGPLWLKVRPSCIPTEHFSYFCQRPMRSHRVPMSCLWSDLSDSMSARVCVYTCARFHLPATKVMHSTWRRWRPRFEYLVPSSCMPSGVLGFVITFPAAQKGTELETR